ncbi:MAG: hypothetical protein R2822_18305 [Spirosomataceae bacterium]
MRGELMYVIHILEKAIAEAKAAGFLGKNILGSGYDLELVVQPGGGLYAEKKQHCSNLWKESEEIHGTNLLSPP